MTRPTDKPNSRRRTGGGPGTNQYKVRGQSKRRPKTVHGYPADQVIRQGQCVWLQAGFDDIWCLEHRKLAPGVRGLAGMIPCVTRLGATLQRQLAEIIPPSQLGSWIDQVSDGSVRSTLLHRVPPDQLGWAAHAKHRDIRRWAAWHMPVDQLAWATRDEDATVRQIAAYRLPPDQLAWAKDDPSRLVREAAAERIDGLRWAVRDPDEDVRRVAAKHMPVDQLPWATTDEDYSVRKVAAQRLPEDRLEWAATDENWQVRQVAAQQRASRAPTPPRPAMPEARWIGPQ